MTTYTLPERDPYDDWAGYKGRDFAPTPRQRLVMDAVAAALAAGLYYTRDVRAHCAAALAITPEVDAHQHSERMRVEGGTFGMDCYYARGALDAIETHRREDEAAAQLALKPGDKLPPLMFADFKLTLACVVEAVGEGGRSCTFTGKRGRVAVRGTATAYQIANARDRAAERKARRHRDAPRESFCV